MLAKARMAQYNPRMNKLELAWAAVLALNPKVRRFEFEGVKLRMADGLYYKPDFFVVMNSGLIELHETKGFMREAARVRLLACADLYPEFQFRLIKLNAGQWDIRIINGAGTA